MIGGTLITFIFSIWAIRLMGPEEYGKANIVVGASNFLVIFLLFGLTNSAMRYLSREKEHRGEILGSILIISVILLFIFLPIFLIITPLINKLFRLETELYFWAIGYSLITAGIYLSEAILLGIDRVKERALITIGSGIFFAVTILIFSSILKTLTFKQYIFASIVRWLNAAIAAMIIFLPLAKRPSLKWMAETLHFGLYHLGMYAAGFFLFFSIDALMLNYFINKTAVGIYSAYYMTFHAFAGKLFHPIIDAFYPMASTIDNTRLLFDKIYQVGRKVLPLIFIASIIATAILFYFYGKEFPFQLELAALMSTNICIYIANTFMASIIGSRGLGGAKFLFIATLIAAAVNVSLNAILIPKWQVAGVMLATTAAFTLLTMLYWIWLRFETLKTSS